MIKRMSFALLLMAGALAFYIWQNSAATPVPAAAMKEDPLYLTHIQPLFDRRCVACHACASSPCQLNLTSFDGVHRGAHKLSVYDFPKIESRAPTRLLIDASTEAQWRDLGFFPVTSSGAQKSSILNHMLSGLAGAESGQVPVLDSFAPHACLSSLEPKAIAALTDRNPAARMPLGFAALTPDQIREIADWQLRGARGPTSDVLERRALSSGPRARRVSDWEAFFNGPSVKHQLASRYIYEHLFLAHLYFSEEPNVFYRLVRSRTREGDVSEIATPFPFDDPGGPFHYRLRPVIQTLTHKDHIPFPLTAQKRARWEADFYQSNWTVEKMSPYGPAGANPFRTFAAIPARARARFFLDESGYHVMTFIKGPVCRGQTALNVINDNFWVLFLDPDQDPLVKSAAVEERVAEWMELPAELGGELNPFKRFRDRYWEAIKIKFGAIGSQGPLEPSWIWNGDGVNTNAALTVYRHFDSAMVLRGLRGRVPKTIWVLDYHVFETIYYNLTAGYNVYGPLLHQLNSRLYMDLSRIASEDLFLSFLPSQERLSLRAQWSAPVVIRDQMPEAWAAPWAAAYIKKKMEDDFSYQGQKLKAHVPASKAPAKIAFLQAVIKTRLAPKLVASSGDLLPDTEDGREGLKGHGDLRGLIDVAGRAASWLPDATLIHVKSTKQIWTWVHNKAHTNVSFIFFEDARRRPELDTMDLIPGVATSYPNYFLEFENEAAVAHFAEDLRSVNVESAVGPVLKKVGIRRLDPAFWDRYEQFSAAAEDPRSHESGWLDLSRYWDERSNPSAGAAGPRAGVQ